MPTFGQVSWQVPHAHAADGGHGREQKEDKDTLGERAKRIAANTRKADSEQHFNSR